jgi:hypothetical protein
MVEMKIEKLEEILGQFTADFLGLEKNKNDVVAALRSKTADQSQLDAFRASEEKLGIYMQFLSATLDAIRAELTKELQIANATEYASKLGVSFTAPPLTDSAPKKKK